MLISTVGFPTTWPIKAQIIWEADKSVVTFAFFFLTSFSYDSDDSREGTDSKQDDQMVCSVSLIFPEEKLKSVVVGFICQFGIVWWLFQLAREEWNLSTLPLQKQTTETNTQKTTTTARKNDVSTCFSAQIDRPLLITGIYWKEEKISDDVIFFVQNLVIRFLKKAASNLQQPFKVVVPSHKLPLHDRWEVYKTEDYLNKPWYKYTPLKYIDNNGKRCVYFLSVVLLQEANSGQTARRLRPRLWKGIVSKRILRC